jgi:hypothetical protein
LTQPKRFKVLSSNLRVRPREIRIKKESAHIKWFFLPFDKRV